MNLIQLKDHRIDEQTEQKRQKQYSRPGVLRRVTRVTSWVTAQDGGPGRSRTADQQFRKLLLYPTELRGRCH
jgi:hypothetical protein